jgi:fumarylacetoacetate (FAA) hydrolase family protein
MPITTDAAFILPDDFADAALMGRIWRPDLASPSVVAIRADGVFDITDSFPTASQLAATADPAVALRAATGERVGTLQDVLSNTPIETRDRTRPWLLAPIDLQVIKAAGVTFAVSMLERVIEERARGNPDSAEAIRAEVTRVVGNDLSRLKPGSVEAQHVKEVLIAQNAWSQYLEVGIGPDAEVFTKAPVLSAVGTCTDAGLHPKSVWNNPEPEVVLVVTSDGRIVGASLGNDVNLRDFEGRSALLLSKAKDNNASCAIGPFVRFFDAVFTLDDIRAMEIRLEGFILHGESSLRKISRDPADIVGQTINENHQYPDGFVLFLGTAFAPIQDRAAKGQGFTHVEGDLVTVATPKLGRLTNRMRPSGDCEPWKFGLTALISALMRRAKVA